MSSKTVSKADELYKEVETCFLDEGRSIGDTVWVAAGDLHEYAKELEEEVVILRDMVAGT